MNKLFIVLIALVVNCWLTVYPANSQQQCITVDDMVNRLAAFSEMVATNGVSTKAYLIRLKPGEYEVEYEADVFYVIFSDSPNEVTFNVFDVRSGCAIYNPNRPNSIMFRVPINGKIQKILNNSDLILEKNSGEPL